MINKFDLIHKLQKETKKRHEPARERVELLNTKKKKNTKIKTNKQTKTTTTTKKKTLAFHIPKFQIL